MGRAIVLSTVHIAILICITLSLGFSIGRVSNNNTNHIQLSSSSSFLSKHVGIVRHGSVSGAFVLLVNMKFTSTTHRDTFLKLIEPVCQDVFTNEGPGSIEEGTKDEQTTFSYQVAISDHDPLHVVIMERYSDKDNGYMKIHRSGVEFLKFREKLTAMQKDGDVSIDGESFIETDLGWI